MSTLAKGTFEVEMKPQSSTQLQPSEGIALGRMSLDKKFAGDLVASSQGEMLTAVTATQGSAGYVAIERVVGAVHGRAGSFVLQHSGLMDRGAQQLVITVVPDSGTGELLGMAGRLAIKMENGQHFYELEYSLP